MREDVREAFHSVVSFLRENHEGEIDREYEFYWEEEYPEDFLMGTALDIAFINFEDWLVCDRGTAEGEAFVDLYMREQETTEGEHELMRAMKGSVISLYEVVGADGRPLLRDLLLGEEVRLGEEALVELQAGDVFATRLLDIGGERLMAPCVYPFKQKMKDHVLEFIDKQFQRYVKNKNPQGTMRQFLKEESYVFNATWVTSIFKLR